MYNLQRKNLKSFLVELKNKKFSLIPKFNFEAIIYFDYKKSNNNKNDQN